MRDIQISKNLIETVTKYENASGNRQLLLSQNYSSM